LTFLDLKEIDCSSLYLLCGQFFSQNAQEATITYAGTKNHQVTITFMENQGNTLINTEKMKVDEHALVLIKTNCTITFSIPKLIIGNAGNFQASSRFHVETM